MMILKTGIYEQGQLKGTRTKVMRNNRFKSYFGETAQIALRGIPDNRKVISVIKQCNDTIGQDYFEVVTESVAAPQEDKETAL